MQAAAGRARRLLTSPAASGILSAPRPGCAALAGSGALLPRLDGVPSSPSPSPAPPLLARSFSATSSSRLPRNLLSPSISSQWRNEKSVCYHMAATHYSTEASDIDQPTGYSEFYVLHWPPFLFPIHPLVLSPVVPLCHGLWARRPRLIG
jgi:hypothetical protein